MPDQNPSPRRRLNDEHAAVEWVRFRSMMKWMLLASIVASALALLYLARTETLRLHMVVATIAGVGLTVLVGTALMGLVFLSNRTGHDDDAARGESKDGSRDEE